MLLHVLYILDRGHRNTCQYTNRFYYNTATLPESLVFSHTKLFSLVSLLFVAVKD